jgi:O-antigen/teichoic acid export membrane protein
MNSSESRSAALADAPANHRRFRRRRARGADGSGAKKTGAQLVWGIADQGLSSATNFGLSFLAGRLLGPSGLGVIFLGFSAYLIAFSFVRALVIEPFVVSTAALDRSEREAATRVCLTLVLGVAAILTLSMALIGVALGGALGRSLILFSPWVALALVQELWRASLFRDQRGRGAAINDGVWAAGMLVTLPFAWLFPSEWIIAATWGIGAAVAAIFGVFQLRVRPAGVVIALQWWKTELRVLGSWLAIENLILALGTQALVFVLAAQLGAGDIGGIRAVEVVFAPMSLFGEAFAFPGTPIVARALASSLAEARRWAWRLSFGASALIALYFALTIPLRGRLLATVFGPDFRTFARLALPLALAQLLRAAATGFALLTRADRRVHSLITSRVINTGATLVFTPLFAWQFGVMGAVLGLALGSTLGSICDIGFGMLSADIGLTVFSRQPAAVAGDADQGAEVATELRRLVDTLEASGTEPESLIGDVAADARRRQLRPRRRPPTRDGGAT